MFTTLRIKLIKITTWWRKYSIIRKSMLIIAFLFVIQNSQSLRCLKIRVCLLLSWKQRNDFITMLSSLQTEKILVIITTTLHSLAFNWRSWFKTKLTTCRVESTWSESWVQTIVTSNTCHTWKIFDDAVCRKYFKSIDTCCFSGIETVLQKGGTFLYYPTSPIN